MKRSIVFVNLFWVIGVVCNAENLPTGWTSINSSTSTSTTLYAVSGSNGLTIQNNSTYTINGDLNLSAAGNDFSITVNGGSTLIITGALVSSSTSYTTYITVNSGGNLSVSNGISVNNSINFQNNGSSTISGGATVAGSGAAITVNGSSNLTVNGNLTVGNNASVMVNGALTVNGNMTGGTGSSLTNNGGATTNVYGNLTGFTLSGNLSGINTNLPIVLTYFTVSANQDCVTIHWQTASEENNNYFTIERSVNAVDFDSILTINGAGNSTATLNYSANDYYPVEGTAYYRLKQTDFDGKYSSSDIISVQYARNHSFELSILDISPMPYNNENLTLYMKGIIEGEQMTITIMAVNGQLVYNEKTIASSQEISIQPKLAKGFYILLVNLGNSIITKKMIVE